MADRKIVEDYDGFSFHTTIEERAEVNRKLKGYDVAVDALRMILKNTNNFRPSHCEWPKSTAHNALEQLGELDAETTPD